jgi:hypothetical protein
MSRTDGAADDEEETKESIALVDDETKLLTKSAKGGKVKKEAGLGAEEDE